MESGWRTRHRYEPRSPRIHPWGVVADTRERLQQLARQKHKGCSGELYSEYWWGILPTLC